MSGEIVSRLTADATQVKSAVGSTASIALRNLVLFVGAMTMMVVTSPSLSARVTRGDPRHRPPARRLRPAGAAALAPRAGHARRRLRLSPTEAIGAVRTVQAYVTEGRAASRSTARRVDAPSGGPRGRRRRVRILTAIAIFIVFSSIVAVLWLGAQQRHRRRP